MLQGSEAPTARSAGEHTEGALRAPLVMDDTGLPARSGCRQAEMDFAATHESCTNGSFDRGGRRPEISTRLTPPRSAARIPPTRTTRRGGKLSTPPRPRPAPHRTTPLSHATSTTCATNRPTSQNEDFVALQPDRTNADPHRQRPGTRNPGPSTVHGHSGRGCSFFRGALHPRSSAFRLRTWNESRHTHHWIRIRRRMTDECGCSVVRAAPSVRRRARECPRGVQHGMVHDVLADRLRI